MGKVICIEECNESMISADHNGNVCIWNPAKLETELNIKMEAQSVFDIGVSPLIIYSAFFKEKIGFVKSAIKENGIFNPNSNVFSLLERSLAKNCPSREKKKQHPILTKLISNPKDRAHLAKLKESLAIQKLVKCVNKKILT